MSVSAECNFVKLPQGACSARLGSRCGLVGRAVGGTEAPKRGRLAFSGVSLAFSGVRLASSSRSRLLRKRSERLTEPPPRERRFGPPKKKSRRWALTNSRNAKLLQGHKLRCLPQWWERPRPNRAVCVYRYSFIYLRSSFSAE